MSEQRMIPGPGFRAVLQHSDGTVLVLWMPRDDVLAALSQVRQVAARGDLPERIDIERVA